MNISTTNIDKAVSMLFSQRRNADKHRLTQLWFSTENQRWNNTGSSTLNRRNSFNVVSTLLCQRWNNVDKHTLAQLSFSTKFQRWNNIGSSMLNRRNSIDVVSTLFCQRWNNVDKCTSAQLSFSTKNQRWNNVAGRWRSTLFQRRFNVDVFAGKPIELGKSLISMKLETLVTRLLPQNFKFNINYGVDYKLLFLMVTFWSTTISDCFLFIFQ